MFTKLALIIITITLLFSLAGCGTVSQSNQGSNDGSNNSPTIPSGTITGTTSEENYQMLPIINSNVANMVLDESANGTTQQLKKGEAMSITLETNPSTGFSWFATISDANVLVQMGEPQYQAPTESATPIVGAPEKVTFYFQAAGTGTATLTLDYQRGFEQDVAPEKTITITVEVQ